MRPARKGPENRIGQDLMRGEQRVASMRPARKGPENVAFAAAAPGAAGLQ